MRLNISEENVINSKSVLEILFPNRKSRIAAKLLLDYMKENNGRLTKNALNNFARRLENKEILYNNMPFKYSRRNLYGTVLKNLVKLGFIQRNAPVWDDRLKRTLKVYQIQIFDIPNKPPAIGFWRIAYYICRKWNEEFSHFQKEK
ncbi:MAG: hypothetical protein N3F64_03560 [Nitrososphaeria archaeon]|nr:hypothetical protein [Nitrososphaeria archaeon]